MGHSATQIQSQMDAEAATSTSICRCSDCVCLSGMRAADDLQGNSVPVPISLEVNTEILIKLNFTLRHVSDGLAGISCYRHLSMGWAVRFLRQFFLCAAAILYLLVLFN